MFRFVDRVGSLTVEHSFCTVTADEVLPAMVGPPSDFDSHQHAKQLLSTSLLRGCGNDSEACWRDVTCFHLCEHLCLRLIALFFIYAVICLTSFTLDDLGGGER